MQKVAIFGALTALFFLLMPATRAQDADEVEKLRRENGLLKKENERLKKEIVLMKTEAKPQSDAGGGRKNGAPPRTKAVVGNIEYELVKCVRNPKARTRVT